MAITVDDLPVAPPNRHSPDQIEEIHRRLLDVFEAHDVVATGFVNESRLEVEGKVDPARVAILEAWLDRGHGLGNHGYGHLDLHRVEPDAWLEDVWRGERVTRPLVESKGRPFRFFRHPFLRTGRSAEIQRRTTEALRNRGYRVAPVTIDNGEWIYGGAYADAWNQDDDDLMRRLGEDYVRYMLEVVTFYEGQTEAILGRPIPHVLLLHDYALNAHWLGALLEELVDRGYRFIPLEDALEDPAYGRDGSGYTGGGGITWLHRWAITEGVDRKIFRGEPEVPAWVEAAAEGR